GLLLVARCVLPIPPVQTSSSCSPAPGEVGLPGLWCGGRYLMKIVGAKYWRPPTSWYFVQTFPRMDIPTPAMPNTP
ncbi:hypothetical protein DPEC_G00377490, partial [Dallia pectoralis]